MKVLLLGGTAEARELSERLAEDPAIRIVSSLAGRTAQPHQLPGETRIGGFGGADGLAEWIRCEGADAVVDATHPFAERISFSAAAAARECAVPLLALRRPGWSATPGDDWHWVGTLAEAAALVPGLGRRVFLTVGRQGIAPFAHLDQLWFLARCVDLPNPPVPLQLELLLDRGPFRLDSERALLHHHSIAVLVTKDSGGTAAAAKLAAARELGCPVVVVRRPPAPDVATVPSVEAVLAWLRRLAHAG